MHEYTFGTYCIHSTHILSSSYTHTYVRTCMHIHIQQDLDVVIALAPIAYIAHMSSPLLRALSGISRQHFPQACQSEKCTFLLQAKTCTIFDAEPMFAWRLMYVCVCACMYVCMYVCVYESQNSFGAQFFLAPYHGSPANIFSFIGIHAVSIHKVTHTYKHI